MQKSIELIKINKKKFKNISINSFKPFTEGYKYNIINIVNFNIKINQKIRIEGEIYANQ